MTAEGAAGAGQGEVTIYTDGGAEPNPGTGGWGVVLVHPASGKTKELSGGEAKTTNNRMELTAAIRALESLKDRCRVELYTDSQYLRRGITEWLPKWRRQGWKRKGGDPVLNADLWKELASCTDRHAVNWKWVKGHAGNQYNERADALATKAIRAQRKKGGQPDPAEAPLPKADFEVFLKVSGGPRGGWAAIVRQGEEEEFLGGASEGATSNLLDVMAAAEVLDRLPPKASVAFVTASDYLRNGATQWIRGWSRRGWKTASGSPVKNSSAWRRLDAALRRRKVLWPNVKGRKMPEMKELERRLKEKAE